MILKLLINLCLLLYPFLLFCVILIRLEDLENKIDKLPHVTEQEEIE